MSKTCWLAQEQKNGQWKLSLEAGKLSIPIRCITLKSEMGVKQLLQDTGIVFVHKEE